MSDADEYFDKWTAALARAEKAEARVAELEVKVELRRSAQAKLARRVAESYEAREKEE